jgi:hypothetical protein
VSERGDCTLFLEVVNLPLTEVVGASSTEFIFLFILLVFKYLPLTEVVGTSSAEGERARP